MTTGQIKLAFVRRQTGEPSLNLSPLHIWQEPAPRTIGNTAHETSPAVVPQDPHHGIYAEGRRYTCQGRRSSARRLRLSDCATRHRIPREANPQKQIPSPSARPPPSCGRTIGRVRLNRNRVRSCQSKSSTEDRKARSKRPDAPDTSPDSALDVGPLSHMHLIQTSVRRHCTPRTFARQRSGTTSSRARQTASTAAPQGVRPPARAP